MKKGIALLLTAALLSVTLCGCGVMGLAGLFSRAVIVHLTGEATDMTLVPSDQAESWNIVIEGLSFTNSQNVGVEIIYDKNVSVEAQYPADMEKYGFSVTAKNGEIRVKTKGQHQFVTSLFSLRIRAPFGKISLSGGCPLQIDGQDAEKIGLKISGASDCVMSHMDAKSLSVDVSGASELQLEGKTEDFELDVSGACNVSAGALLCTNADLEVSGAGNVSISVSDSLTVELSGVGAVEYYGSPEVDKRISGAGTVQKAGDQYDA